MRNIKNHCRCGDIDCDARQDLTHLIDGIWPAGRCIIDEVGKVCDPRRDAPRVVEIASRMVPTSEGADLPKSQTITFIGVSEQSAVAIQLSVNKIMNETYKRYQSDDSVKKELEKTEGAIFQSYVPFTRFEFTKEGLLIAEVGGKPVSEPETKKEKEG